MKISNIAYSAAFHRQHLEKRLALKAPDKKSAADLLERFSLGEKLSEIVVQDAPQAAGKIAFVYSGNGAQWVGMGQRLLSESPRFARSRRVPPTSVADDRRSPPNTLSHYPTSARRNRGPGGVGHEVGTPRRCEGTPEL